MWYLVNDNITMHNMIAEAVVLEFTSGDENPYLCISVSFCLLM